MSEKIAPSEVFHPDPERHRIYTHYRKIFDALYIRNKDLMHNL